MSRDITIDIAKGIGIILVVIGHVPVPYYRELYIGIYMFHMPLFFFLSGCFFKSGKNVGWDIYKKIRTILVPYFVFSILGNGSFWLRDMLFHKSTNQYSLIGLLNASNSPLWFLGSLFVVFLIYELLDQFKHNLILWGGTISISLTGYYLAHKGFRIPFLGQALPMLFYYALGREFMQRQNGACYGVCKTSQPWAILALIIFVICCNILNIRPNVSTLEFAGHPIVFFFGSLTGIWLCIYISNLIQKKTGRVGYILMNLGQDSLYIMGLHFYVIFHVYFFFIPIIMRIYTIMGYTISGEKVKMLGMFNIMVAIATITISLILGKILQHYVPCLFRITNNIKQCK